MTFSYELSTRSQDTNFRGNGLASIALGNEIRAYEALRETGDDVTRGAIFLMILLVPFAVAMERLVFARPKIGQRITLAVAIFVPVTTFGAQTVYVEQHSMIDTLQPGQHMLVDKLTPRFPVAAEMLAEAREEFEMPFVAEVLDPLDAPLGELP